MEIKGSITFSGALQIALIVLKLTGVINNPWFIVLLPIELSLCFAIALIILYILLWRR